MADALRVLVLGDAHGVVELVVDALRRAEHTVEICIAGDAEEAAKATASFAPDLVLSRSVAAGDDAARERVGSALLLSQHGDAGVRFRDIIEYSRDLFFVHGPDHVLTYVSPQSREFFDCEPEEALVRWTEFSTDNPVNELGFELTQRAIDTGERQPAHELELVSRTGRRFWVEVREEPVVRSGCTAAIVGSLTDITERKRTQERLALLAHALRSVGEGVCMTDEADRIQFVNDAFCRLYGYGEAELVGHHIGMLRADDVTARRDGEIREGTLGAGWHGEIWNLRKDGTQILVSLSTSTVRDEQGKPLALVGVIRDVTETRRMEDALRESEDRYRDLVEQSADLICTHDLSGVFLTINMASARAVGYDIADLVGRNLVEFLTPRGRSLFPAYLDQLGREGSAHGIMEIVTRTGEVRYWEYDNTVRTKGVAAPIVRGRARDVTERLYAEHSLRTSERRYHALFDGANDGVLILRDFRFTECNPKACELYGRSLKELVGMAPWEVSPTAQPDGDDSQAKARRLVEAALAGAPQRFEWEHTRGDGSGFLVEVSLSALPIGNEKLVQAVVRDVTVQRRAAEAERRRLRQLSAINRIARQVASELDPDAVVLAAVREVHETFGYYNVMLLQVDVETQELGRQAIAGAYECIAVMDFRQKVGEGLIGAAAASGQTVTCNDVLSDPRFIVGFDVEIATRSEIAVPIRVGNDVIAVLDVQEARPGAFDESDVQVLETLASEIGVSLNNAKLYAALKGSEDRYRTFFEQDLTADFLANVDGAILEANPAFAEIFGYASSGDAASATVADLYPNPKDRARTLRLLREQRRLTNFELELRRRDGTPVHVVANLVGIFDEHDELTGVRTYLFDITAHKTTEEQLRQAQKMEAVGRLAGGVAHDFNNLLQAMLATVGVLRHRAGDTTESGGQLAELEDSVRRGAALTRQLLLFARREVSTRETLDLGQVLSEAVPMLRRLIPENIPMVMELGSEPLPVVGDRGQLQQVLMNLVVNAVDAMPGGGSLTLRAGRSADTLWWEVADSGAGMTEEVLRRLFEPFFTTKRLGTGLGLAVAHGIVTTHGGRIEATSMAGNGSTFRITLPCAAAGPGELEVRSAAEAFETGHGERVLLVEDEPAARAGLGEILDMLGYTVESVESAEAALDLPSPEPLDVLLTDYVLPGRNGLELASALRVAQPGLGVILMSGYAEDTALRGGTLPAHIRYLQKPFDVHTLARILRDVLNG